MANSTFDYFRKHTKVALVVLGALCILAFVVADPLMQYLNEAQSSGPRSQRGKVAVSWDGGKLTEGELGTLVAKRQVLAGFLANLEREGQYLAIQAGVPAEVPPSVDSLNLPADRTQNVEQDVVQSMIFAQAARDAGMVVSDETIAEYLEALGRDYVSRDRMREMIGMIQIGNGRATPDFIFGLLREALLSRNFVASYAYARATVLPQQRWEDWLKVNDRVVIETGKLAVEDFVSQVKEPTDTEIAKFFEEYKEAIPGDVIVQNTELPAPTPGFRTPAMAKVQYLKTDFAKGTEAALGEITDEDIAEYYEENKAMFVKSDFDLAGEDSELESATAEEADADTETAPEAEPAEEGEADSTEEQAAPEENESGAAPRRNPFRFVADESEVEEQPAEDASEESTTSEDDTESEPAEAETDAEETNPADPLAEFMQGGDDAEEPAADSTMDTPAAEETPEKPVEYQPLEEVKEVIRERLAQQKAAADQQQKLQDLLGILQNDYNGYFTSRIDAEAAGEPAPEPPAALVDWEKLAAENGLEFGQSELLSFFKFRESPLGELRQPIDQSPYPLPLSAQVFRKDGLALYEPAYAFDLEQNQYLVMKVEYNEEITPKLEDVRDEVVRAWKHQQAAELAVAKAEELAKQAQSAGQALKQFFADNDQVEVEESDRFGWYEPFTVSRYGEQDLRLGDPGSIDGAGPDFMEKVFSLGPNEVGAALDHGKSAAYVIRIALRESSEEELRQNFLRDWNDPRLRRAMDRKYIAETARAVYFDLLGGEEPDWKRTPDQELGEDA